MKLYSTAYILFLSLWFFMYTALNAQAERLTIDLSKNDWGIVRDFDAEWFNDEIYLSPADIAKLPMNPPLFGWNNLDNRIEKTVQLPATIEEHFWAEHGNTEGVAGDYRGVSWWITNVSLDSDIVGKRIFLDFDSVHLRAEVFVNMKLMGYDVIGHTPFSVDITEAVMPGTDNEIAVRIPGFFPGCRRDDNEYRRCIALLPRPYHGKHPCGEHLGLLHDQRLGGEPPRKSMRYRRPLP